MNTIKKIYKALAIIAMGFGIWGCSNDFLDQQPTDSFSTEVFWKTQADAELALAGVYSQMQNGPHSFEISRAPTTVLWWDMVSPDGTPSFEVGFSHIINGTVTPTSTASAGRNVIEFLYTQCYKGIGSANIFLENIDGVQGVSADVINQWKGEVRFIRGFWYLWLATTYGDVPLHLQSPSLNNQDVAKSSQSEIFAQVEEDLNFAIANLPEKNYSDGHANKGAAYGLLARTSLYQNKFSEATTAAQAAINGGSFSLTDDYPAMFIDATQENNNEIMFSIKFGQVPGESHSWGAAEQSELELRLGEGQFIHPTRLFVDSFECIDGLSINDSPLYDPANPMLNRDPRLSMMIYEGDWNPTAERPAVEGFTYIKWMSPEYLAAGGRPTTPNGHDAVVLRYADVLLMYAESKIESGAIDASVLNAINQVRARAYGVNVSDVANYPEITTTDPTELRQVIRDERRWEFHLEYGHRYFDLKRWGIAEQEINGFVDPASGVTRAFLPKHYKLPLPQAAIDRNSNLVQNPDY